MPSHDKVLDCLLRCCEFVLDISIEKIRRSRRSDHGFLRLSTPQDIEDSIIGRLSLNENVEILTTDADGLEMFKKSSIISMDMIDVRILQSRRSTPLLLFSRCAEKSRKENQ